MMVFHAVAETADGTVEFYGTVRRGEDPVEAAARLGEVVFGARSVRITAKIQVKESGAGISV